jgi:hypothetical protein
MCCLSILWIFLHTGDKRRGKKTKNQGMKISNFTRLSGSKCIKFPLKKKKKQLAALKPNYVEHAIDQGK